jgi:hypothetical protein
MRKVPPRPASIPSTSRTLSHHRNPRLPQTSIHQLPPIRLPKIQANPSAARLSFKKLLRISKLPPKLRTHFVPHGIAASPNARPHRRHQILHPRPILRAHLRNAMLHNPRHCPSPPSMKRRHHSLLHIDHQHRNAIRRPHSHQHPRHIRHQPISLKHCLSLRSLQPPLQRPIPLLHHAHYTGVYLPHSHQRKTIVCTPNTTQKPPSILRHQSWIILLRPPKIQ